MTVKYLKKRQSVQSYSRMHRNAQLLITLSFFILSRCLSNTRILDEETVTTWWKASSCCLYLAFEILKKNIFSQGTERHFTFIILWNFGLYPEVSLYWSPKQNKLIAFHVTFTFFLFNILSDRCPFRGWWESTFWSVATDTVKSITESWPSVRWPWPSARTHLAKYSSVSIHSALLNKSYKKQKLFFPFKN